MTTGGAAGSGWDYFVSYAQMDRAWAEWVAWELEAAGFAVLVQAWDMPAGSNWVATMQEGVLRAARTVAVLSDAYASSVFGAAEWAWAADLTGRERKLLVVRVADYPRPGLLASVVAVDVFGVSEAEARARLIEAVRVAASGRRAKPAVAPRFPGDKPPFPATSSGSSASTFFVRVSEYGGSGHSV